MTAASQNGYSANDRSVISTRTIPGTTVRVPVRDGPAGDLLLYAAGRWHREVEPLNPGECWGYAERPIRGGTELSNHASGTALDLNATKHPLGQDPSLSFTAEKRTAIRRVLADCRGALRWGGDYTGRKDGMHLEVDADEVRCAQVLTRLPDMKEDDMELTDEQVDRIAAAVWQHAIRNGFGDTVSAAQILTGAEKRTAEILDAVRSK